MPLTLLSSGYQELDWPRSWEAYYGFRDHWGLTDAAAIRALALGWYARTQLGQTLFILSGRRSAREQAQLYEAAQQGDSNRPAAKPGDSLHQQGRAFDVGGTHDLNRQQWAAIGRIGEQIGLTWGGTFMAYDPNHFQV